MKFDYVDQLIANCEAAKLAKPTKKLTIKHGQDLPDCLKKGRGVYVFKEVGGDPEKTFTEFAAYKTPDSKLESAPGGLPRINTTSDTLYVGSSRNTLQSRLNDHIGSPTSRQTSAQRLKEWFTGEYQIEVRLFDVNNDVLPIIEDNLSDVLKPAFGKQGGNSK